MYCTDVRTGRTRKGKKDMHRENNHDMDSRTNTRGTPSPWEVLVARAKKKVTEYCYWWYKKVHFPRAKRGASSSRLPVCTLSKHLEPSSLLFHSAQSKPTNTTPIAHPLAKVEVRNIGCLEKQRRKQSQRKARGGNFWVTFQWWSKVFARALVSVDGQGTHSSFRALSLK
jgi:hypothetical protein